MTEQTYTRDAELEAVDAIVARAWRDLVAAFNEQEEA